MELSPVSSFSEILTALKGVLSKVRDSLMETMERLGRKIIEGMQHIKALVGGGAAQFLADVDATVSSRSTVVSKTDHVGTRQLKVAQAPTAAPQIAFAKDGSINVN
ncbi:hypothetical protein PNK_1613 [Candidatus Protochlamydia naegleriophila]|uniref:Uncharacterized protein n=1 Tax=Candidatus Protochlamydia naegleriophila TaxID=389348 RepID=A0A0U5JHF4_9BACT|nr:hypothetical protein [Candidatus Protochlamydia naegleriophila]CUI17222.1 hypothetical protein PNK_1613 [Candidatus Protochlamydia naegleriophila]